MPFSPLAVANTFIERYGRECGGISHMKLQKLVFYTYGWWLAFNDEPLTTEGPQVWRYGPVFNSLYGALASFGMKPIESPRRAIPFQPTPIIPEERGEALDLIDWVWGQYGGYSAGQLSDMTHAPGTPWQQEAAAHDYRVPRNYPISDARIKTYFQNEAARLNGDAA